MEMAVKNKYTAKDITDAYFDCLKHKRGTFSGQLCRARYFDILPALLDAINAGEYKVGQSRVFAVSFPKIREVWAAGFVDRIVHHLVCNPLFDFYVPQFIVTNCACIKGRGTLYASKYLEKFCRQMTNNWDKKYKAYYLQIDIKNFFVSIDKRVLWKVLTSRIPDDNLTMDVLKKIIFHNPVHNALVSSSKNLDRVPAHKSLRFAQENKGMPIGDLPSQLCASGILLDRLDKFVKHELKCKWYVRYVDDAVLLGRDPDELYYWAERINSVLKTELNLELNEEKTKLKPIHSGIDFVGRVIKPFHCELRRSILDRAYAAAEVLHKCPTNMRALEQVNAYLAMLRHVDGYNIRQELCNLVILDYVIACKEDFTQVYYIHHNMLPPTSKVDDRYLLPTRMENGLLGRVQKV